MTIMIGSSGLAGTLWRMWSGEGIEFVQQEVDASARVLDA